MGGAIATALLMGHLAMAQSTSQEKVVEQAGNWVMAISGNAPTVHSTNSGTRLVVGIGPHDDLNVFLTGSADGQTAAIQFDDGYSLNLNSSNGVFSSEITAVMMPAFIHALTASKSVSAQSGSANDSISLDGTTFAIDALSFFAQEHDITLPPPFKPAVFMPFAGSADQISAAPPTASSSTQTAPSPPPPNPSPPPTSSPQPPASSPSEPAQAATLPATVLSVNTFILDRQNLIGQTVTVSGFPTCLNGDDCSLYGQDIQNSLSFSYSLPRSDVAILITCDLFSHQCPAQITGIVTIDETGEVSIIASQIKWLSNQTQN